MARTYEALEKKRLMRSDKIWHYLEFSSKKQIGDIEKRINFLKQKNDHSVFNFTSSRSKEGVSTIIANLIAYLEPKLSDKPVLLVDTNFRNPVMHNQFNIPPGPGISDCLIDSLPVIDVIQEMQNHFVHILSCGQKYKEINGSIDQDKIIKIMQEIKQKYQTVIIDSPPLLSSSDALSIAVASDVTFLTIQALKTTSDVAKRAMAILSDNECFIGGSILNRVHHVIPDWMYKIL